MSILSGEAIRQEVAAGNIKITPYEEKNIQPASIDLTLGYEIKVYTNQVEADEVWSRRQGALPGASIRPRHPDQAVTKKDYLDPKEPLETTSFEIGPAGFVVMPGVLYLMHTYERLHTDKFVSVLDGKSSIGRLGVVVHLTAGYGDPGFDGQYTLEVSCIHPVILYPRMKIAQMRFHTVFGSVDMTYATRGHYVGDKATGAIPSMAYKQFREDHE